MSSSVFHFRRFSIQQGACAMKVGIDGVLLGAWAQPGNALHILDIGCGTGLLSLMLAQKCDVLIDAVEIDAEAARQAAINFATSPWSERIKLYNTNIQTFVGQAMHYDYIICNPPYYQNSPHSPHTARSIARHDSMLDTNTLLYCVGRLLTDKGHLALIIPYDGMKNFIYDAMIKQLYCNKKLIVRSKAHKTPSRVLMEFSFKEKNEPDEEEIIIHNDDGSYSNEYKKITEDYYL